MTTFKFADSRLRQVIASATVLILCAGNVFADGPDAAPSASMPGPQEKPVCDKTKILNSALHNRYVLLLFFDKTKAKKADIQAAFLQTDHPDEPGCIRDPDQDAKGMRGIIVQGSCPTDCAHPNLEDMKVGAMKSAKGGDPLKRTRVKLGNSLIPETQKSGRQNAAWALYMADPLGEKEESKKDDPDLGFFVWQILPKDACHAASILKSLKQRKDTKVFQREGGYLGQLMIGYTPRWKWEKSTSVSTCEAVEPRDSVSR